MTEMTIHGHCAPHLERVREAFAANFTDGMEAGAAFAVQRDGEPLIDIWAGDRDSKGAPWERDTLAPVFSTGKAVSAIVIASLVEAGRLDYEAPLAGLWPEFDQAGKGSVTVGQALSHQAGVPGFKDEIAPELWFDEAAVTDALAAEAPFWDLSEGGSGYHAITFGVIAQEIAKRASGRSIGTILREDFAAPHDLDVMIGTPESEHARTAAILKPRGFADFGEINAATRAAFLRPWSSPGKCGAKAWREAEFPAANCHATARGLASLLAVIADSGTLGGARILSESTLDALTRERVQGPDRVLPFDISWAAGLVRNRPAYADWFGPGERAVGHYGFGGSMAMADPETGISAAYVMNQQGQVLMGDERPRRLLRALYDSL